MADIKPYARDLFGEIPVTQSELTEWVERVAPHIFHSRWRTDHYIRDWHVAEKIKAVKLKELGEIPIKKKTKQKRKKNEKVRMDNTNRFNDSHILLFNRNNSSL